MARTPNISCPIDHKIDRKIQAEVRRTSLSRADVVRQILKMHFGLLTVK